MPKYGIFLYFYVIFSYLLTGRCKRCVARRGRDDSERYLRRLQEY